LNAISSRSFSPSQAPPTFVHCSQRGGGLAAGAG